MRQWLRISVSPRSRFGRGAQGRGADRARGRDGSVSPEEELARLQAENARPLKAEQEWQLEREILRRAAAYCAREVK